MFCTNVKKITSLNAILYIVKTNTIDILNYSTYSHYLNYFTYQRFEHVNVSMCHSVYNKIFQEVVKLRKVIIHELALSWQGWGASLLMTSYLLLLFWWLLLWLVEGCDVMWLLCYIWISRIETIQWWWRWLWGIEWFCFFTQKLLLQWFLNMILDPLSRLL